MGFNSPVVTSCRPISIPVVDRSSNSVHSLAYRSGVINAVAVPQSHGFIAGLSTAFSLGAEHKLAEGAVLQEVTALHVSIGYGGKASVSTQIAALRKLLLSIPEDRDATELSQSARAVSRVSIFSQAPSYTN